MGTVFDAVNPFPAKGVPHWRVKLSGVRQSKIYKCPERSFGSEGAKEIVVLHRWGSEIRKFGIKIDTKLIRIKLLPKEEDKLSFQSEML